MRKKAEQKLVEGLVEAENDGGYKIDGQWYNISKFADETKFPLTCKGKRVRLVLDSAGFVRGVEILGSTADSAAGPKQGSPAAGVSSAVRAQALGFAVEVARYLPAPDKQDPVDYYVAEILTMAQAFAEWLEGGGR